MFKLTGLIVKVGWSRWMWMTGLFGESWDHMSYSGSLTANVIYVYDVPTLYVYTVHYNEHILLLLFYNVGMKTPAADFSFFFDILKLKNKHDSKFISRTITGLELSHL